MSEPATRPFVSCPHCAWAATTTDTDPRGAAWLEESLRLHLTKVHGSVGLTPRPAAAASRGPDLLN